MQKSEIEGTKIHLSDNKITVDGENISTDSSSAVYSKNDIIYYPEGKDFKFGEGIPSFIENYVHYFNNERLSYKLNYKTPVQYRIEQRFE